jgi:glucose-1-phosphate thymidylyltransferase
VVEAGAAVERSVISGPAAIGRNTRVVDSYVGPFTSIDHDCVVEQSEISGSVIMENTKVRALGHRIEHSLIGRNVEFTGDQRKPRSFQVVLGDFSRVSAP